MIKRLTSLSIAGALTLCPLANIAHAANNKETARKIAAIFAEAEGKTQQRLDLEASKRQKLENEKKALLEEVQKLKAEKEKKALLEKEQKLKAEKDNKELQQEIEKLKTNKKKTSSPSVWSSIKAWFRNITGVVLGATAAVGAVLGLGAGAAGAWTAGSAAYDCHTDESCESFTEKMTKERFFSSFGSIKNFLLEVMKHIDIRAIFIKNTD